MVESKPVTTPTLPLTPSISLDAALSTKPNLTCEVHPIFAYKNWLNLSQEDYDLIKPVLQLATMYLGTPACVGFFATCLFGERVVDWSVKGDHQSKIVKESPLTAFKAERVKEMLRELDGVVKLGFTDTEHGGEMLAQVWGDLTDDEKAEVARERLAEESRPESARKSLKHGKTVDAIEGEEKEFYVFAGGNPEECRLEYDRSCYVQDPRTRMTRCTVALHGGYLANLQRRRASPAQSLRMNFMLVSGLLHEVAHVVESGRAEVREWDVQEAVFPGEELPEMGCLLENLLFGGHADEEDVADSDSEEEEGEWTNCEDGADSQHGESDSGDGDSDCSGDDDESSSARGDVALLFRAWPLRSTSQYYRVPQEFLVRIHRQEFWDRGTDSPDQSRYLIPTVHRCDDSAELAREHLDDLVETQGEEYAAMHYAVF